MTKRICVIPGDDAAPEAVLPALDVLRAMELDIELVELPTGEEGLARYGEGFMQVCREAIDACDTTLFGSTSGKTQALAYLRREKRTYANLRPVRYIAGARSPLRDPEGIDFVIVRENTEDAYGGFEGELPALAPYVRHLTSRPVPAEGGYFAVKVITEANSRRIIDYAFRLAQRRKLEGHPGRVTLSCKHNLLRKTDGLFRSVGAEVAKQYPEIEYADYIVDDFARRIVATPHKLDVVVLPNLYGDILSDEAAALVGGLGLAPSGCYGDDFAYFEPVHGSAPDIAGTRTINPTATLLSAAMMLEHLGFPDARTWLESAIEKVYAGGRTLTPDQGGSATSDEFCAAVRAHL